MKKPAILLSLILMLGFFGCKKASELTQLSMPYSTQITIPDQLPILNTPFPITTPPIPTKTESVLQSKGYNLNLIDKILLEKLELKLNSPSTGNLDFMKSIKLYIEADGLPKTLIAQKDIPDSPVNIKSVTLDCLKVDLLSYFKKSEIKISSEITTDQMVIGDHTIDVNSVFMIDVNVLGL